MKQYLCLCMLVICVGFISCGDKVEDKSKEDLQVEPKVVFVTDPDKVLEGPVVSLPQQVINLKGGGLLFIKVAMQTIDLNPVEVQNIPLPRYIDALILVASEFTEDDLIRPQGREKLSELLFEKFNEGSDSEHLIVKVYFENFIVR